MTEFEQKIRKYLEKGGRCPICEMVQDIEFEILSRLQYGVSQDSSLRLAIAREGGFCDFHFRRFLKIADLTTNVLLLLALIDEYSSRGLAPQLNCRICRELRSYEDRVKCEVVRLLGMDSFRDAYRRGTGLCLPHMHEIQTDLGRIEASDWLDELQRQQMQQDRLALEAVRAKSYFGTTQPERNSIPRLVEKFVGRRSFGL